MKLQAKCPYCRWPGPIVECGEGADVTLYWACSNRRCKAQYQWSTNGTTRRAFCNFELRRSRG